MIALSNNRLEEGRWSEGRPVFKKVDGETRFLIVAEGSTAWTIQSSTTATSSRIQSGNFKKVDGETRFLHVKEGQTVWAIRDSTTATGPWIKGGRATNSPSSPEAGGSVRLGVTRWRYSDNGWKEGNISVTCV